MKNRECPYCHHIISLKRCVKYLFKGTNYTTTCNHCNRSVKLEKEPIPFGYSVIAGLLSIFIPMNVCLYYFKLPFLQSLYYSLPFVLVCIIVISIITLNRLFFSKDIF